MRKEAGMSGGNNRSSDSGIITFIAIIFVCIAAMPLVGIYLLMKPGASKGLGIALIIIGLILWGIYFS